MIDINIIITLVSVLAGLSGVVTGILAYLGSARKSSLDELRAIIDEQVKHTDRLEKRIKELLDLSDKQADRIKELEERVRELEKENNELKGLK